jgi:hypothetical protein
MVFGGGGVGGAGAARAIWAKACGIWPHMCAGEFVKGMRCAGLVRERTRATPSCIIR